MHGAVAVGIGYLCGSFPTAYLAGKLLKGIDLRTVGSGNLGASNVFRNLGAGPAIIVLAIDALKGALPVLLLPAHIVLPAASRLQSILHRGGSSDHLVWWTLGIGVAAIVGHVKPIFLLWKGGGKGVATAGGVFAALAPIATGAALMVWITVIASTAISSLASLAAAVALPVGVAITLGVTSPVFWVTCAVSAFVIWAHRTNIARLRAGTEPKVFRRKPGDAA